MIGRASKINILSFSGCTSMSKLANKSVVLLQTAILHEYMYEYIPKKTNHALQYTAVHMVIYSDLSEALPVLSRQGNVMVLGRDIEIFQSVGVVG